MALERSDARYEVGLSEDDLVVFLGVDDVELSDAFESSVFFGAALLGLDLLA
jgi:hypothetical protein